MPPMPARWLPLSILLYTLGTQYDDLLTVFLTSLHPQALVNWDPADGTVLADEQVDAQGRSWRSGALVERRLLRQWFVRATRFSERLLRSLDSEEELRDWRDVTQLQKHWIGPCDGWKFELQVGETGGW